jgi:hypothetical protein
MLDRSRRQALWVEHVFSAKPGRDLRGERVRLLLFVPVEKATPCVGVELGEPLVLQQMDVCEKTLRD